MINSYETLNKIIKRRLEVFLARHKCNMCHQKFKSISVLFGEGHTLLHSDKRFFSVFSKAKARKPITDGVSAPCISRHNKEPKSIFLRRTCSVAVPRRLGNIVTLMSGCDHCGNDMKTEINMDNIANLCSK